jgi:hypothetical protein
MSCASVLSLPEPRQIPASGTPTHTSRWQATASPQHPPALASTRQHPASMACIPPLGPARLAPQASRAPPPPAPPGLPTPGMIASAPPSPSPSPMLLLPSSPTPTPHHGDDGHHAAQLPHVPHIMGLEAVGRDDVQYRIHPWVLWSEHAGAAAVARLQGGRRHPGFGSNSAQGAPTCPREHPARKATFAAHCSAAPPTYCACPASELWRPSQLGALALGGSGRGVVGATAPTGQEPQCMRTWRLHGAAVPLSGVPKAA